MEQSTLSALFVTGGVLLAAVIRCWPDSSGGMG